MQNLKCYIEEPDRILMGLSRYGFLKWMPDDLYLKIIYRLTFKKKLNLENPTTYNEKLQWLKLYDRNSFYTTLVDKLAVKEYIRDLIGEEYVVPVLGVWERAKDIDFSQLPDQFVLKCNHDSGGIVICKDKASLDIDAARKKLSKHLRHNAYWYGREWPYKNVVPRIIAEPYLVDTQTGELPDYKIYVFNGIAKVILIVTGRYSEEGVRSDFYDADFNHLEFTQGRLTSEKPINKPQGFKKIIHLAETIAKDLPAARVDFYEVDGRIYFGEVTFFDASGLAPFHPPCWDEILGSWFTLPPKYTASENSERRPL